MEAKIGVYCIENIENNKKYIGSSKHVYKRRNSHFNELKRGKHKNIKLQRSYDKHGRDKFVFYIIEVIDSEIKLIEREQFYIDKIKPEYNINLIANSSLGVKRSDETKEKVRQANLGLKHPEWRNKIKGKAQGGENHWTNKKVFSDKSKEKMSNTHKELYKNGYVSPLKGKKKTKEQIDNHRKTISKTVIQYDLNGVFIKEWLNCYECQEEGFIPSCINKCCNDKRKTHNKFIWKFKEVSK